MRGMKEGRVIDFPLKMSPEEKQLIDAPHQQVNSIILVSRSGTGKTTCMLYKIWGLWRVHHEYGKKNIHKVLFITASATLKRQVRLER